MIKKLLCCALAALMLCSVSACGKDNEQPGSDPSGTGSSFSEPVTLQEPTGAGFTHNHAIAAGYGLGTDTLDDIRVRFGEPTAVDTQEFTALTIVTADYPFGQFIFNGENGGTPVLTSVSISSQYSAPMGIDFTCTAEQAVETIYKGSAAMLGGNYEQNVVFYGDGVAAPRGSFTWLTAEFVTTSSTARYSADYVAPGFDAGMNAKMTLYFNTDGQLVNFTLLYVRA